MIDKVKAVLLGLSVGDALGVPVEFVSRNAISKNPVVAMRGFGTHNQMPGTWSDDSSLSFCLADSLCNGYNLQAIAKNFVLWYDQNFWTAHNQVFDVGIATSTAIQKLRTGIDPSLSGGIGEGDNGNGSLMRIIPIIFYTYNKPIAERFDIIKEVSGITHRHIRSIISCFIYTEFALQLLAGIEKNKAFKKMQKQVNDFLLGNAEIDVNEVNKFHRILENAINDYEILPLYKYEESDIYSSGYVLHTLEASLWCILKTNSYKDAVLKAVNLGDDTNTTGCVTGGLAALIYGYDGIPENWLSQLARKNDIITLAEQLAAKSIIFCNE